MTSDLKPIISDFRYSQETLKCTLTIRKAVVFMGTLGAVVTHNVGQTVAFASIVITFVVHRALGVASTGCKKIIRISIRVHKRSYIFMMY